MRLLVQAKEAALHMQRDSATHFVTPNLKSLAEALLGIFYKKLCCCRGTARHILSLATTKVTFKLTRGHL